MQQFCRADFSIKVQHTQGREDPAVRKFRFYLDQSGSVAVIFAVCLTVMLGIAAVVIDLGHAFVVKREVQQAAEAGALAGARALALDPAKANGLATSLNWSYGKTQATNAVKQNYANGATLSNFNTDSDLAKVQSGYWDMHWTSATAPANLNGYLDPAGYAPDTTHEIPAVKVTLAQNQDGSGGTAPTNTYFASVLGVGSMTVKGSAVAILPSITKTLNTSCFPFAIPKAYADAHWSDDPPTSFTVGSVQHDSSGGQWTSLGSTDNAAAYIDSLIMGTETPAYISKGDQIYIQDGEKSSVYNTVLSRFTAEPGHIYMVPIVEDGFSTGAWTHVTGFVPYMVTGCTGSGEHPYVEGHFVPGYFDPTGSGVSGEYTGDPGKIYLVN
jgi:Flp pilus assembly protein TadG